MKYKAWIRQNHHKMKNKLIRDRQWRKPINLLGFVSLFLMALFLLSPYLYHNLPHKKFFIFSSKIHVLTENHDETIEKTRVITHNDPCLGRYIYIHDLPSRFNDDVLRDCGNLTRPKDKTSMCNNIVNHGFGTLIENSKGVLMEGSWYSTNQFMLEVIFHERMKKYKCLTDNSSAASAIFVPFYAGLDLRRHLWRPNTSVRDSSAKDLLKWLKEKPEWKGMMGHDHFLVTGRISWDFQRKIDKNSAWGSKFMLLPESRNLSFLTIERNLSDNNVFGIPYPTYFHPSKHIEVYKWQEKMRTTARKFLFSFAGAQRSRHGKASARSEIIRQCKGSNRTCKFLDCEVTSNGCDDPVNLMRLFQSSVFCLQPPGDSLTRRSIFDSILAGCIPVFFHKGSAYEQYSWYLHKNFTKYSVYIPMKELRRTSIEETLLEMSEEKVVGMREEVIRLIPKIIYSDPNIYESHETFEDAFDVAVKGILERIDRKRRRQDERGVARI